MGSPAKLTPSLLLRLPICGRYLPVPSVCYRVRLDAVRNPRKNHSCKRLLRLMLGTFQQSQLRIEVNASATALGHSLTKPTEFQKWLFPQQFSQGLPENLQTGDSFTSWMGPIAIQHTVEQVSPNGLRFLLSGGIDGFHEWCWGEGWVQSRLEGISLLPLNLGQTLSLLRLRQFLATRSR